MRPIAVLCGGRGTRLKAVTGDVLPKAMVEVAGRPFIDLKLDELARQGFTHAVLLVGFGADAIRAHVDDGARFGLRVDLIDDGDVPLGTGGSVRAALGLLGDAFWVTYGDTLLDVDAARVEARLDRGSWTGVMTVLHNRDAWGVSNARVDGERIAAYAKAPPPTDAEHIDYGMVLLRARALRDVPQGPFDLADVLTRLAAAGELGAFEVTRRFYEIGTPKSLREVEAFVRGEPPGAVGPGAEPGDDGAVR